MILKLADQLPMPMAMIVLTEFHIKNGTIQQKIHARQVQRKWIEPAKKCYYLKRKKETAIQKIHRKELEKQIQERRRTINNALNYASNQRAMVS